MQFKCDKLLLLLKTDSSASINSKEGFKVPSLSSIMLKPSAVSASSEPATSGLLKVSGCFSGSLVSQSTGSLQLLRVAAAAASQGI